MMDESIYHFFGCWVYFVTLHVFLFLMENPVSKQANNVDPDQMPHDVTSDLGLDCLPMTLIWV